MLKPFGDHGFNLMLNKQSLPIHICIACQHVTRKLQIVGNQASLLYMKIQEAPIHAPIHAW
jgi:hypothetical protein